MTAAALLIRSLEIEDEVGAIRTSYSWQRRCWWKKNWSARVVWSGCLSRLEGGEDWGGTDPHYRHDWVDTSPALSCVQKRLSEALGSTSNIPRPGPENLNLTISSQVMFTLSGYRFSPYEHTASYEKAVCIARPNRAKGPPTSHSSR
jgi:hypothetical protein